MGIVRKILFLCHGNICRSPMAEFVMKDLVRMAGRENDFEITSAAVTDDEKGNPVYPPVKVLLEGKGICTDGHRAHRITSEEFKNADLVIVMDDSNLRLLSGTVGRSVVYESGKVHKLMEYTSAGGHCPDVADPWYTRDFERSYRDILAGCTGLLEALR